jgi:transposase
MKHKELKNIAEDDKVSLRSVQRIYKNLKHHGHTYSLPSQVSQGRPRRFTSEMEKVI